MKCRRQGCPNEEAVRSHMGLGYCSKECAPLARIPNVEDKKASGLLKIGLTINDITQFQKRAIYVAKKNGRPELAEDFAQEVLLAITQGRRATIDQLFVDYLRSQFGRSGTPGGRARQMAASRTVSLDEEVGEEGSTVLHHELVGRPGGDLPDLEHHGGSAFLFGGVEATIYQVVFLEERPLIEAAEVLGVTQSRVSQRVNSMRRRIQEHFLTQRLFERYRDEDSFGVLEVEWLGI